MCVLVVGFLTLLVLIEYLFLRENQLTGSVPSAICSLESKGSLKEVQVDCSGDSPEVSCQCCANCAS